jgi:hypothetical protein
MAVVAAMTQYSARKLLNFWLNTPTTANITVSSSSGTVLTSSSAHGLIVGDLVRFIGSTPTGLTVNQTYYVSVVATPAGGLTFEVSATAGGSSIGSLSGSGTCVGIISQAQSRPYVWLAKTAPTSDTGTGLVMATFTYTAQQLPSMTVGDPSSPADYQRAFNSAAINFSITGTGDTCSGIVIARHGFAAPTASDFLQTATNNPVLYYGDFSSVTLNNGDTLSFAIGGTGALTGIAIDQY